MTGEVMNKVNDEFLKGLRKKADDMEEKLAGGKYPDAQSLMKDQGEIICSVSHLMCAAFSEGLVTVAECAVHRKRNRGSWKAALVYCATGLGAFLALLKFVSQSMAG